MATAADIQARIDEAEAFRHLLLTGQAVTEVNLPNGLRTIWSTGGLNIQSLNAYIDTLKSELNTATTGRNRRPIYFNFGR